MAEGVTPPRVVDVARWLWVAAGLLFAVRTYVALADRQGLRDQVRQADSTLTMQQVEAAVNGEIVLGVLFCAVIVALYVLVANKMLAGRSWARVLLTFFGVVFAVSGLLGLIGIAGGLAAAVGVSVDPTEVVLSVLGVAVDVAALVAMWLPPSSAYFRTVSTQRVMPPPPTQFMR
jgi:hypothetical protein